VGNIQNVINAFKLINETHELNTIIFCTHDIELAVQLADTVYVIGYPTLDNGNLEMVGTIVEKFDLKEKSLAWHNSFTKEHIDVVEKVKTAILNS
jgi:energy-coupling factor transporter ATP-binding protein EcfA2